jgi:hyperosmotically inducible protein
MKIIFKSIFLIVIFIAFSGCSSNFSGWSTIYGVAVDERGVSTIASDQIIVMKLSSKFLEDKSIKFLDFSTYCYRGNVFLIGEYDQPTQKEKVVKIAESDPEVKSLTIYMLEKKKDDSCGTTNNLAISTEVKAKLIQDKDIRSTNIDVKVVQCHVVLLGIVGSKEEIAKAVAQANSVEKIRGVECFLTSME